MSICNCCQIPLDPKYAGDNLFCTYCRVKGCNGTTCRCGRDPFDATWRAEIAEQNRREASV